MQLVIFCGLSSDIHCRCLSLLLCTAGLSYGHSGLLYSGKKSRHRHTAHLNIKEISKIIGAKELLSRNFSYLFSSLCIKALKYCHRWPYLAPTSTISSATHSVIGSPSAHHVVASATRWSVVRARSLHAHGLPLWFIMGPHFSTATLEDLNVPESICTLQWAHWGMEEMSLNCLNTDETELWWRGHSVIQSKICTLW